MSRGAYHGGAFFEAIGVDLQSLNRAEGVVSADVLDAWFDPAPAIIEETAKNLPFLLKTSPPLGAEGVVAAIAEARGVPAESIVCGAGSSSLLFACLPRLLPPDRPVVLFEPMYGEYAHISSNLLRLPQVICTLTPANEFLVTPRQVPIEGRPSAVLLVNPNNPTGRLWPKHSLRAWLDGVPEETLVVIDETYIDYAGSDESLEREAAARNNLVVIKSMSKAYALSGLRVAYLVTHPRRAAELSRWMPPWALALPAQLAAILALRERAWYAERHALTRRLRDGIRIRSARVYPSDANFYLLETERSAALAAHLRERRIFVREFPTGPLSGKFLRIAVKDEDTNARIVNEIEGFLG